MIVVSATTFAPMQEGARRAAGDNARMTSDTPTISAFATPSFVGVVVIGRNEGERLKRCLTSLRVGEAAVVYVDSGSSDGSAAWARQAGAEVVELDMSVPFTAARGRNAGFERLRQHVDLRYVQFVDGDCEMRPDWLQQAQDFMEAHPEVVCVCGRLRERFPEASIYNRLADMEWNRAVGETDACGGIAMMRIDAFIAAGGFRNDLIAGEEPELCLRLRARGGRVWRLADEMAWHDSAMTLFGQWWRRAVRGGHALAEGMALHGERSSSSDHRRMRRALGWGAVLPIAILALACVSPWAWLLFAVYPARALRLGMKSGADQQSSRWTWAVFMVISTFAEVIGIGKYWLNRALGKRQKLIEYK